MSEEELMAAAPQEADENPEMLMFSGDSDFEGVEFRPFARAPQVIAATLIDQPFCVEGECFEPGDYLCIGEFGVFGLPAEVFTDLYRPRHMHYLDTYRAYHDGAGTITLEPAE